MRERKESDTAAAAAAAERWAFPRSRLTSTPDAFEQQSSFDAIERKTSQTKSILMNVTSLQHRNSATPSSVDQRQRPSRSSRATSVLSVLSADQHDMMELFDDQQTTGVCLLAKMLLVVGVPAIAVVLLSSLLLVSAIVIYRQANDAIDELGAFYQVDQLVTNLQVERGTTATYLSSDGANSLAMSRLVTIRRLTDHLLDAVSRWPTTDHGLVVSGRAFHNQSELGDYLETYRGTANNLSVTFEQNIEFYTAVNFALMSWSQSVVVVPHHATLRRRVPRPEFDMDIF